MGNLDKMFANMPPSAVPRLPVCILVDTSYSMIEDGKITTILEGIESFIREIDSNPTARDSVELAIVSYSGKGATLVQYFDNVVNINFVEVKELLKPIGNTPMAKGLDLAIDVLNRRKNELSSSGTAIFKPWLIIMGDGNSDENIDKQVSTIQNMYRRQEIKAKCIGVGEGCEDSDLQRVSPNGKVEKMNNLQIRDFCSWLSVKASSYTLSTPDMPINQNSEI